jgi:hypothetical protein
MKIPSLLLGATFVLPIGSASAQDSTFGAITVDTIRVNSDTVNALNFVAVSDVLSGVDVSRSLQAALDEARRMRKALYLPNTGPCYLVNTTLDPSDVEMFGAGTCINTTANVDTIRTDKFGTNIHDLKFTHSGATGRVVNFIQGEGHQFWRNRVVATNPDNRDPIVFFALSNNRIKDNNFTNFRSKYSYTWQQQTTHPKSISINNQVVGNYMGGSGRGGIIGDNGQVARPEGTLVAHNDSVLLGGPFITLNSVLSVRLIGNMMDQNNDEGAIRIEPKGFSGYGVDGILVSANYISAVGNKADAPAIQSIKTGGHADAFTFTGNEIAFGSMAARFAEGITNVQFTGNVMHGFSKPYCIELGAPSLLQQVTLGDTKQCQGGGALFVPGHGNAGSAKSTRTVAYHSATGGNYINVPHGLAGTPTQFTTGVSTANGGTLQASAVKVMVVRADATNVVLQVQPEGVVKNGTVKITLTSEIAE